MARSLKAITALIIVFAILGIVLNFFGPSHGSSASNGSAKSTDATTVSPEELTRAATPLPVQEIENYQ